LAELKRVIAEELDTLARAQRATEEGATHEESKPENDKDTRALESSYLARGQAQRVVELSAAKAKLDSLQPRTLDAEAPVALGTVCVVELDDETQYLLLAPAGAGLVLTQGDLEVRVITSASPIGRALIGKRPGDDAEVKTPQGLREYVIIEVI
jgi:transcription elongation GreA/GreB family factor